MISHLNKVINRGLIELDLKGKSKDEVVEELTDLLVKENILNSKADFIAKVNEREATMSTFCGSEVAIPHAISSAVKAPAVCFGRSKGFFWDNSDEHVQFVFLFALPEENHNAEHIAIISSIARCSLDPDTREIWLKATTEDQVLESLRHSI